MVDGATGVCPDANLVAGLVAATLAEQERLTIEAHLAGCDACRETVAILARSSLLEPGRPGAPKVELRSGQRAGRYALLEVIGSGAMGQVWAAYDPELDRKVALKFLHHELSPTQLVLEARAMARVAHPNVVPVLDMGGLDGRTYLAMEFVDGVTLRAWLAQRDRSFEEIAPVLLQAARGLEAAHAVGITHRDFKPENVLIGRDGRARVVDFGLARSAEQGGAVELAGTPFYMAPEQLRAEAATPACDQFAFCVAAWEALFGSRPFDAGDPPTLDGLLAAITAGGPPSSNLRGELAQWQMTLLRGLHSDPARRFPSLTALVATVDRTRARPRGRWVGAVVAATLIAAVGGWAASRFAPRCRVSTAELAGVWDDARRRRIAAAFHDSGVPYADRVYTRIDGVLEAWARGLVEMRAQACAATQIAREQPIEVLALRNQCLDERRAELASLVEGLSRPDAKTIERASRAAAGLSPMSGCADVKALTGPLAPQSSTQGEVAAQRIRLARARALEQLGRFDAARAESEAVIERARALGYPPLEAEALVVRGVVDEQVGAAQQSVDGWAAAVIAAEAGRDDPTRATAWAHQVSVLAKNLRRFPEARRAEQMARAILTRLGDPPEATSLLEARASVVDRFEGQYEAAERHQRRALMMAERAYGAGSFRLASFWEMLGVCHKQLGRYPEAEVELQRALALYEQSSSPDHPAYPRLEDHLAHILLEEGKIEEAIARERDALARFERFAGPDPLAVAGPLSGLGKALLLDGRDAEALAVFERWRDFVETQHAAPFEVSMAESQIGNALTRLGRFADAKRHALRAVALAQAEGDPDSLYRAWPEEVLGDLYVASGDRARARTHYTAAIRIFMAKQGVRSPSAAETSLQVARLDEREGAQARALAGYRQALEIFEEARVDPAVRLPAQVGLARVLIALGRLEEAVPLLERGLATPMAPKARRLERAELRLTLAQTLVGSDPARAQKLVEQADELAAGVVPPARELIADLARFRATLIKASSSRLGSSR